MERYIGLMTGTSMDGIDAAILEYQSDSFALSTTHCHPIPEPLRQALFELFLPGNDSVDLLGHADSQLGAVFADAVSSILRKAALGPDDVRAIGCHGQTIRHRPPGNEASSPAFSLQIGDPNLIAAITGIPTVADFRRKDIALGGHGAPLAPAFHHAAFHNTDHDRAVVNIGGISNLTHLPIEGPVLGYDCGPGNGLMDAWVQRHLQQPYDDAGRWAASHSADEPLLEKLLQHPFFHQPTPKSTGREDFNLDWLDEQLDDFESMDPGTVQATLLTLTVTSIASAIHDLGAPPPNIYICGGGAYNLTLMDRLAEQLKPSRVQNTGLLGIAPEWVEAAAFAWLAERRVNEKPGNLPSVTGARKASVLGGLYLP